MICPETERFEEEFGTNYTNETVMEKIKEAVDTTNASVQNYKHISRFVLSEEFPKNASKKILRQGLEDKARELLEKNK